MYLTIPSAKDDILGTLLIFLINYREIFRVLIHCLHFFFKLDLANVHHQVDSVNEHNTLTPFSTNGGCFMTFSKEM